MTPDDFRERVWRGLHDLRRQAYHTEKAKIVVHPGTRAVLLTEIPEAWRSSHWYRALGGEEFYMGQPFETDARLDKDSILIRYEVEA